MTTGLSAHYSSEAEREHGPRSHDVYVDGRLLIVAARSKGAARNLARDLYPNSAINVPGYKPTRTRTEYNLYR